MVKQQKLGGWIGRQQHTRRILVGRSSRAGRRQVELAGQARIPQPGAGLAGRVLRAGIGAGAIPAIWINFLAIVAHLEMQVRRADHKASFTAATNQVASTHAHALAGIDQAAKFLGEFIKVPVNGDIAIGVLDPYTPAAVRTGVRNAVGGSVDIGANRLVGEIEIVAVVAVVLHLAVPKVVHHRAIIALAGVNGWVHMIEVGQVYHACAGGPGPLQETISRGGLRLRFFGQLVVEVGLKCLAETPKRCAPLGLAAAARQQALHRNALGGLLERERQGCAVGEAHGWRALVGAIASAQFRAGPVDLRGKASRSFCAKRPVERRVGRGRVAEQRASGFEQRQQNTRADAIVGAGCLHNLGGTVAAVAVHLQRAGLRVEKRLDIGLNRRGGGSMRSRRHRQRDHTQHAPDQAQETSRHVGSPSRNRSAAILAWAAGCVNRDLRHSGLINTQNPSTDFTDFADYRLHICR